MLQAQSPPFQDLAPSSGNDTVACADNCEKNKPVLQRLHSAVRFNNDSFCVFHFILNWVYMEDGSEKLVAKFLL